MKTAIHKECTGCAQSVHRFGIFTLFALALAACAAVAPPPPDPSLIRNPTVPIGAILRFDPAKFDGNWVVHSSAGGTWDLVGFSVSSGSTLWREQGGSATLIRRATGILQMTYADGQQRDLWVIWTDPDHHTVAIGNPEGDFGFIATREGRFRMDQVSAAAQVLDFNGYRTANWTTRTR